MIPFPLRDTSGMWNTRLRENRVCPPVLPSQTLRCTMDTSQRIISMLEKIGAFFMNETIVFLLVSAYLFP